MAELKTKRTDANVEDFIDSVTDETKRNDCKVLLTIFQKATGEQPAMWGDSMVGYGTYHYKSERSAQEGDWPLVAFSPRKQNLTIYIMPGFDHYKDELERLGKHTTSVGCLYIKKLADVDLKILEKIVNEANKEMRRRYT